MMKLGHLPDIQPSTCGNSKKGKDRHDRIQNQQRARAQRHITYSCIYFIHHPYAHPITQQSSNWFSGNLAWRLETYPYPNKGWASPHFRASALLLYMYDYICILK